MTKFENMVYLNFSNKDQSHKGKYKSSDNIVVARNEKGEEKIIFRPTLPYLVKKEMDDVLHWLNGEIEKGETHPLILIANFIFEFLAIHPFTDGNGRLSRVLTNLLLLQSGYEYTPYVSLEEIIEKRKDDYYDALRQTQKYHKTEEENINQWLSFFLDTLLAQAKKAKELVENDDPTKLLSGRQSEIYTIFQTESLSVMDIKSNLQHIPEITIKQSLARLVSLKLIERIGLGSATRYIKLK
ncbi:MAG: Fic family protein [bacterium]